MYQRPSKQIAGSPGRYDTAVLETSVSVSRRINGTLDRSKTERSAGNLPQRSAFSFRPSRPNSLRIVIVLNPASGRGRGARLLPEIKRLLANAAENRSGALTWEVFVTKSPGDGIRLANKSAKEGADIVAAAGGDGTINEVVNGIAGTGACLGVMPLGTGNDFARCIGIGPGIEHAINTLVNGKRLSVDLGRAKERWFINAAGCGFDGAVADRVNRGFRFLKGTPAYIAAVLQTLIGFRPADYRLTLDGETRECRAMMCAISNGRSYGGGMMIAPDAEINDGLLDICIVGDMSKFEFVRSFPRVFKGTHVTHPKVATARAKRVAIETDPGVPVLIDGEVIGETPVEFTIEPSAIEVMTPALRSGD